MSWQVYPTYGSISLRGQFPFEIPGTTSSTPGHFVSENSSVGKEVQNKVINRMVFSHCEALELLKNFIRAILYITPFEALSTHMFCPLFKISLHFHSLNPISSFPQCSTICSHLADMVSFSFSTEKWLIYYSRGSSSSLTAYRRLLNWALKWTSWIITQK